MCDVFGQGLGIWTLRFQSRKRSERGLKPAFRSFAAQFANVLRVGPDVPRGSRLGPVALNSVLGFLRLGSTRKPMKQFCISSQFCGPQTTSFAGSGLYLLLAELSKCAIPTMRVPLAIGSGFSRSNPSCQLKSHFALKIVLASPDGEMRRTS